LTKEDIIRMAEEAGFETCNGDGWPNEWLLSNIEKFANLIAAHEREACAKQLDGLGNDHCAAAIRARGRMSDSQPQPDYDQPRSELGRTGEQRGDL
jgi:hypothetical protein